MTPEVPAWQRIVVPVGFVVWLTLVPGAWLYYRLTASEGDLYGIAFGALVLFSGAVWLCVGVPLAVLSVINRMRWGMGLHALALAPLLALFCFLAYYVFLALSTLWYS